MSRRTGVVAIPNQAESGDEKKIKGRTTVKPKQTYQRGKNSKRRPASESDSESLFHIDDAAAFKVSLTEGDTFKSNGQFKRAVQSYTRALEKQPNHRGCLLARSQCYQQIGDNRRALADANKALQEDEKFIKGLLQKAECYYNMAEFELALVHYHRGNKIRPEIQAFRLGVQKSQEAIENCIGESAMTQLTEEGDLSFFAEEQNAEASKRREAELAAVGDDQRTGRAGAGKSNRNRAALGGSGGTRARANQERDSQTVKQLLGNLYADKEYLEKLLDETEKSSKSKTKEDVIDLTVTCLDFLDTREEFWNHQQIRTSKSERAKRAEKWLKDEIKIIKKDISDKKFSNVTRRCSNVLDRVKSLELKGEKRKQIALLHSLKGRAHLELNERDLALAHHEQDLKISTDIFDDKGADRAIENIVKVYLKYKEFNRAAEIYQKLLKSRTAPLERAWLHHELGKCHFEMKNIKKARECGKSSLRAAEDAKDLLWQLNAKVLIAQCDYEKGDKESALKSFNEAHEIAEELNDREAQKAIKEAISQLNDSQRHNAKESSELNAKHDNIFIEEESDTVDPYDKTKNKKTDEYDGGTESKDTFNDTYKMSNDTDNTFNDTYKMSNDSNKKSSAEDDIDEEIDFRTTNNEKENDKRVLEDQEKKNNTAEVKVEVSGTKSPESSNKEIPELEKQSSYDFLLDDSKNTSDKNDNIELSEEKKESKTLESETLKIRGDSAEDSTMIEEINENTDKNGSRNENKTPVKEEESTKIETDQKSKAKTPISKTPENENNKQDNNSAKDDSVKGAEQEKLSNNKSSSQKDDDNVSEMRLEEIKEKETPEDKSRDLKGNKKYEVEITMSDIEGAGTAQQIYVQLVGENGVTRKEELDRDSASYERGRSYTINLSVLDVGKISKLIIGHAGSNPGTGCHISKVTVREGSGDQRVYNFLCDQWFDKGQDDHLIERELLPSES